MANALTAHTENRRDRLVAELQSAQGEFTAVSAQLKLALTSHGDVVAESKRLESDITATRAQMAGSGLMPSEIEALAEQLRQLLIDQQHNAARVAIAAESLRFVEADSDGVEERIGELESQLRVAETDVLDAQKREANFDLWTATETEDAINVVRGLATDLIDENPITVGDGEVNPADVLAAAKARIEGDIPEVLRGRASARATLVANRVAKFSDYKSTANDYHLSHGSNLSGSSALVAQRWIEYEVAEAALRDYAQTSENRYANALDLLASIGESPELSQAEFDRIAELDLAVDSDEILTEAALHDAQAAVAAQLVDVELALVAAMVADITADPEADAAVIAARGALATLQSDLASAESAHTTDHATAIDLWEGAVPDYVWANLQNYDIAMALLGDLRDSSAASLIAALNSAESALITAATSNDEHTRLELALAEIGEVASRKADFVGDSQRSVSLSAMRGDY